MKKINVKDLIDFRRRSDRRKKTFVNELNFSENEGVENETSIEGRDYWVRSLTALSRAFKEGDNSIIAERIEGILEDYKPDMIRKTQLMYDRNLQILHNYEDFDFSILKPTAEIEILEKSRKKGVLTIKDFPIKVLLHQIYSFDNREGIKSIGCVLFLAKLETYKPHELGIFAEAVFNFLKCNYSDKYLISAEDIRIVDVMTNVNINYQMVLDGEIPSLLINTLDEIITLKNNLKL